MGKKTKKKGSSSSSSAAATKGEKDLKRAARQSLIDKHGRMPREDGIRFYALLDFVAHIVSLYIYQFDKFVSFFVFVATCHITEHKTYNSSCQVINDVENERRLNGRECWIPLHWPERDGLQRMPDSARTIVLSYIWKNIHRITDEIDAGHHDELFLKKVGRRIEEKDKSVIRSWRNHIKDDFVVINHLPHKGSVFVQVGRVAKLEQNMGPGPMKDDSDIHDPRVFFIQGLATPLKELCESSHEGLMKAYPSLKKKYADLPISFIHATILPYNNGLTYGVTAEQQICNYYETPQQYAEAVKIAHDCYKLLVLKNNQETTTNNILPCKIYDTITPDIVRQAKPSVNVSVKHERWFREELGPDEYENDPEMTCLHVQGMIWMPFPNTDSVTDPRTMSVLQEVTLSERPLKVVREGFKHRIKWEVWFYDHEPCPFHRRLDGSGTDTLSFAECCKKDHLKRLAKAKKREEDLICTYWYNPVEEEEADCISHNPVARQQILNTIRIGPHDCSDVRLRVPLSYVDEVKWRMDNAQIYLPIIDTGVEYKWIYLGWIPVAVGGHAGLLSFGDITLNTETGDFVATAMTAGRCAALITRMKFVCSYGEEVGKGIPVEDISLIGTQMGKSKPDKAAMSRNVELLKEDFDIKASMAIDKVSRRFLRCEYCGKVEDEEADFKLLQCACKKYYYCNKEHQKLNWKDHKATCIEIREGK